ncbi:MAG: hypothetical protein WCT50_00755 [Patescibacteria group bacterium]
MKKPTELDPREREILSILNQHFGFNLAEPEMETKDGIKKILDAAWGKEKEDLHKLDIPKFKIAQMYDAFVDARGYAAHFLTVQKKEGFLYISC